MFRPAVALALVAGAILMQSPYAAAAPIEQGHYPTPLHCDASDLDCDVPSVGGMEFKQRYTFDVIAGPSGDVEVTLIDDSGLSPLFVVTYVPFQTFEVRTVCSGSCRLGSVDTSITVSVSPLDITGQDLLDHAGSTIPTVGTIYWEGI
jgi:hypothetical protein